MYQLFSKYFIDSYRGFSVKIWITVFATLINYMGTAVTIFLALYLSKSLHYSVQATTQIVAASGLGGMIGAYVGGIWCGRFQPIKISILTLMCTGLCIGLVPAFSSYYLLLTLTFLAGFFGGAFKPANTMNLLDGVIDEDRAKTNGLYRVAANLGMALASVLGGFLVIWSYQAIFISDAALIFLAAIILFLSHQKFKLLPVTNKKESSVATFKDFLSDKVIVALFILLFINSVVFFQSASTFILYLSHEYHISDNFIGYTYLINCTFVVLFEVPILNATKIYNQMYVCAIGAALICASFFILLFGHSIWVAYLSCVLSVIGEILLFTTVLIIALDRAPSDALRGKSIGIYGAIFSAAMMFAPLIGGYIYAFSPELLWLICGLLGVFSVICFYAINRQLHRPSLKLCSSMH